MKKAPGDSTISPLGLYQPPSVTRGIKMTVPNNLPAPNSSRQRTPLAKEHQAE